jgi:nucleotide-binding universal stress UspA family protein
VPEDVRHTIRAIGSSSVIRGLHELTEETDAAILVLGPTHVGTVVRALAGDVTLGVLHAAPCPVAIAPPGFAGHEAGAPRTVGIAYVDTPEARDALEAAVDLAQRRRARLRVLHVLNDVRAPVPDLGPEGPESDLETLRLQAEAWLEEARQIVGERVPVDVTMLDGDPAGQLRHAATDLDFLVLGSRGLGPLRRVLLGSVSARVVHGAPSPVLVLTRGAHVHVDADDCDAAVAS